MRTSPYYPRRLPRLPFTRPTLVALTSLAASAVLVLVVSATFSLLAALATFAVLVGGAAVLARRRRASAAARGAKRPELPPPPSPDAGDCSSFIVLPAHARADEVTRVLFAQQSYFPVAQGREVVGVISKGRLLSSLAHGEGGHLIAELMNSR
jgi:hypothetical protein